MRRLITGCGVAAVVALTAPSEARPPASFLESPQAWSGLPRVVPTLPELPMSSLPKLELGLASWYGEESNGVTASGEAFDHNELTAAHRNLPLGSKIEVTNLRNNRSLVLRVNDRGPNVTGRLVDVSKAAAERLGFVASGRTAVQVRVLSLPKQYIAWVRQAPTLCMAPRK
jgi:rare lipoprotein A